MPKNDRQTAIQLQNKNGNTLFHVASLDVIDMLLGHVPKVDHLNKLLIANNEGNTFFHIRTVDVLLNYTPQEKLLDLLKKKNNKGITVFQSIKKLDQSLLKLQSKLSADEWYELLSQTNTANETPLQELANSTQYSKGYCQKLLDPLSDEKRVLLMSQKNAQGQTALHLAIPKRNSDFIIDALSSISLVRRYEVIQLEDNYKTKALFCSAGDYFFMYVPHIVIPLLPDNKKFEALTKLRDSRGKTFDELCKNSDANTSQLFSLLTVDEVFELNRKHRYSKEFIFSVCNKILKDGLYSNKPLRELVIIIGILDAFIGKSISHNVVGRFFQVYLMPSNELNLWMQLGGMKSMATCHESIFEYIENNPTKQVSKDILQKLNIDSLDALKKHWNITTVIESNESSPLLGTKS